MPTKDYDANDDPEREASYEEAARQTVEHLLELLEFDEIRGVIHLMSGTDHRYNETKEEFGSLEEVRDMLTDKAEAEWINTVPWDKGPVFEPNVDGMVERLLEEKKIIEFFEPTPPYAGEELFSAQNLLVSKGGVKIQLDVEEINDELIRYLALHPEKMRELSPRKFEELIAELYRSKGYDVELTPKTKDGGFDLRAFYRSDTGRLLTLVECKRYSTQNKVEVEIVRALHGVVQSEKATCGMIATTSTFTRGAKAFREKHEYQMHLADFAILQNWLKCFKIK
jgi:hypothetical protein